MRLTRRKFLGGAAAAAVGAASVYELVDKYSGGTPVRPGTLHLPREQHVLDLSTTQSEGVEVIVPPLHSQVFTATLDDVDLKHAQAELEAALQQLEDTYDPTTPAGLAVTVGWGLPYFARLGHAADTHLPYDRRAQKPVLLPTRRFPSDPEETVLERNDVVFLLRSDSRGNIAEAQRALQGLDFLHATTIRSGFAGGGFDGKQSLPKKLAMAAGVPGADLIPDTAELFLGFTSTQKAGLGPRKIANHETLGYVDLRSGYFHGGTHMHLSHISEDLEAWYLNFDFDERVLTAFSPDQKAKPNQQTVPQGPEDIQSATEVSQGFDKTGRFGHSGAIQTASRLLQDHVGPDGTVYPKGTAIPQRADFNTLDNPFTFTDDPVRDKWSHDPAAGVHFVVFNPTGDDFERGRLAMDGVLPDGTKLETAPRSRAQGFNSVLTTTHRQNFLVPPRAHRSFPLAEL
jgi:hypothetical protein